MKNKINKLKNYYHCTDAELAIKIGITERHLQNVKNGIVGRWLKKHIQEMVSKISQE